MDHTLFMRSILVLHDVSDGPKSCLLESMRIHAWRRVYEGTFLSARTVMLMGELFEPDT